MSGEVIIRDANAADAAACAANYGPYVTDSGISFDSNPPDASMMAQRIAAASRSHAWLIAEVDGSTLGYAYGTEFAARPAYRWTCEVSVYLDPAARGRCGSKLHCARPTDHQPSRSDLGQLALPS